MYMYIVMRTPIHNRSSYNNTYICNRHLHYLTTILHDLPIPAATFRSQPPSPFNVLYIASQYSSPTYPSPHKPIIVTYHY